MYVVVVLVYLFLYIAFITNITFCQEFTNEQLQTVGYYCNINFDAIVLLLQRLLIPVKFWVPLCQSTDFHITEDSTLIALYIVINTHILLVNGFLLY